MQRSEQALNPSGANSTLQHQVGESWIDQAFTWLVRIFAFGTVVALFDELVIFCLAKGFRSMGWDFMGQDWNV